MPDFSELLRKPAGEAKRPQALPIGDYQGVIRSFEVGDSNRNHTPYVRFAITLTAWPEGMEPVEGVDLNKRQLRKDFFLTDEALWRLDELIKTFGVDAAGKRYEDVLPLLVGQPVRVEVRHYRSADDTIGNTVEALVGLTG